MRRIAVIGLVMLLAAAVPVSVLAAGGSSGNGHARFLIFTNGDHAVNQAAAQAVTNNGGQVLAEMEVGSGLHLLSVNVPAQAAQGLAGLAGVRGVSRNVQATLLHHRNWHGGGEESTPTPTPEPPGGEQLPWGVDRIDADQAWADATGAGVTVVIMDSGIDMGHEDLMGNLAGSGHVSCIAGMCDETLGARGDATDDHGTHVAGVGDNGIGVVGVAKNATLLSVNIFDGGAYFDDVIAGYEHIAGLNVDGQNVHVVNQSFGWSKNLATQCPFCITALQNAINGLWNAGIVPVAAAGNAGNKNGKGDNIGYPARLDYELAVAATTSSDKRASFSSTGPDMDLAAPGQSIYSTVIDGLRDVQRHVHGLASRGGSGRAGHPDLERQLGGREA